MNKNTNNLEISDLYQNSAIDIQQLAKDFQELSREENLLDESQDKENNQIFSNKNNQNLRRENNSQSSELQKLKQQNNILKKENDQLRQELVSLKTDLITKYDELKLNNQTMCNKFELKSQSALDEQRIKYESQIERLKDQLKLLEEDSIERKKNFRERNQQLYNMVIKLEKEKQEILEKNIKLIHNRFSSRYMDETLNSTLCTKTNKSQCYTQQEPKITTKCNQLVNEYRSMLDNHALRSRNFSIQPQQPQIRDNRSISYDQPFSSKLHNINCLQSEENKKNIYDQYLTLDSLQMSKDNIVDNILPKNLKLQNNKPLKKTATIPLQKSMLKNSQISEKLIEKQMTKKEIKKKQNNQCPKNQSQGKQRVPVYTKINK